MRGDLKQIEFLERPASATPTPEIGEAGESFGEIIEAEELDLTPTPTQNSGVLTGLRRAGLIIAVAVFVIILIIAAITRSRG